MRRLMMLVTALLLAAPAWAQEELNVAKIYLGDTPCVIQSGSGDPAGALGCGLWIRIDGNQAIWGGDLVGQTSIGSVSDTPIVSWWETDAAANNKAWDAIADSEALRFRLVNDAYDSSLSWLTVNRTANVADSVILDASVLQHADYASQTTAWGITAAGAADFRYLFTDELHARVFIADLEQALAGLQIITKSVAILQSDFTCPAAAGTATLSVEDLPGAADMQVFDTSDWVALRSFSRASQTLTIGDCVGQVSSPDTSPSGYQTWTFTRGTGGSAGGMSASTVVDRGGIVLDYGVSGAGYHEVNAVDGVDGINSPYSQTVTWATAPVAANRTVQTRIGNLAGTHGYTAGTPVFGAVFGPSSGTNITIDPTNGFRVRYGTTDKITLDASGNATFVEGELTIDSQGIRLDPASAAYADNNAFGWTVSAGTGSLGTAAWDSSGSGRYINMQAIWNGSGDRAAGFLIRGVSEPFTGGTDEGLVYIVGNAIDGVSGDSKIQILAQSPGSGDEVQLSADLIRISGEVTINTISGSGAAVCIKSDGNLGTCTNQPNGSGVCTCS